MSSHHPNGNGAPTDQALRASELSYRRLFEAAQDGILILDVDSGRITDVNPFLVKLLGFTHDEMMGKTVGELSPFKDIESNQAMLEHLQKKGYVRYEDLPLETRDGRHIAVEFVSNVYEAGEKNVIQCNIRDLTERKGNQEALRKLATTHASILNALPAHIALIDRNGVIVSVNEAWRHFAAANAMQGTDFGVGQNYLEICKQAIGDWSENAQTIGVGIHRVLAREIEVFTTEYPCHSPAVQRWFILRVVSVSDDPESGAVAMHIDITDRKLAEEALRASEGSMAAAQRIAHIGSWEMGLSPEEKADEGPTHCSDEMFRIFGYVPGEVVASIELFRQMVPPDDFKALQAVVANAIAGRQEYSFDHRLIRPNGQERVVRQIAQVIFDQKTGQPLKLIGTTQDITERVEFEQQLLWKTAFFEAQVHSALDGILVVESDGKKLLQNQRMTDLWKIPEEFAANKEDRQQLEWVTSQVSDPGQFARKVAWLYSHPDAMSRDEIPLLDGRCFDRYSAPVRGHDGKYYGRIWSFRDITEQKHATQQITEQAALLDKVQDAVLVRDVEGKILVWNKGAERTYGWTREEAIGQNVANLYYPDRKKFEEVNGLTLAQGEWHGELRHITKDKREIIIEARWTLIRDDQGNPKSVLAINTDITEKKKLEAQFLRAQRMESVGTLAGGIAHDLNNILAPIMMSIDILKFTATDPQARNVLETIEVSARRGADIVRQVLSFARGLEGQRIQIQPRHLLKDLETIIKDTFPKNVRLSFTVPEDSWMILGDPTQVHQILLNLCVNARDAMPNGGHLTIDVTNCELDEQYAAMHVEAKAGRYVQITVTDSGTGMSQAVIEKIFEPFFTTKGLTQGTGLGLSTVMAIVKSHQGMINVYSEPGKGTMFTVCLPAVDRAANEKKNHLAPIILPRGNGETVLVVDDENSILIITRQTLQAFGYRVLTAADGADAVAVYAQHKNEIAVVLTDMSMPVMDGAATIRALTRINPAIKIIAASGLNTNGEVTKTSGIKHFLAKPYTAETLLKVMRTILDET